MYLHVNVILKTHGFYGTLTALRILRKTHWSSKPHTYLLLCSLCLFYKISSDIWACSTDDREWLPQAGEGEAGRLQRQDVSKGSQSGEFVCAYYINVSTHAHLQRFSAHLERMFSRLKIMHVNESTATVHVVSSWLCTLMCMHTMVSPIGIAFEMGASPIIRTFDCSQLYACMYMYAPVERYTILEMRIPPLISIHCIFRQFQGSQE